MAAFLLGPGDSVADCGGGFEAERLTGDASGLWPDPIFVDASAADRPCTIVLTLTTGETIHLEYDGDAECID